MLFVLLLPLMLVNKDYHLFGRCGRPVARPKNAKGHRATGSEQGGTAIAEIMDPSPM